MNNKSTETSSAPESTSKFNLLIAILCGLLILTHFISSFFPKSRLWGIDHLAYFPLWVRFVFTLLGLVILFPRVNSRVYKLLEQILSFFQKILPKKEVLTALLLSVIAMFFFWLLRTRTHFLGDGYALISHLESEQYLRTGFEVFEIYIHLYLYKFLQLFFAPSAESVYAGLSIFAGGVFVFILFFLTKALSEDRFDRLLIFSIFILGGATELFLGYAENYTLVYVSLLAYLYFSLRYIQGRTKIYMPIFFCALATGLHFSSGYFFPSLFFLFALKKKKVELVFTIRKAIPYLLVLAFLFVLAILYVWRLNPALSEIFVPLFKGRPYAPDYTLFSVPHLLDIINQHLLLSPVGIILLVSLVIVFKNRLRCKNLIISFLLIVFLSQISYHFIIDPKLGAGRDWDLMSNLALGYTPLGVYLFINLIKSRRYSSIALIFTAFLCTLPWLLLNAGTSAGINRFRNLLDIDVKKSLNGRYGLAKYYNQQNMLAMAKAINVEIFELFPEDSLSRLAQSYRIQGNFDKAIQLLEKAIEINPSFGGAYNQLGLIYLSQRKADEALAEFQKAIRANPFNANAHINLGYALISKGRYQEALDESKKAVKLGGATAEVLNNIGYTYWKLGQPEKAIEELRKSIKIDPRFMDPHLNLGQFYLLNHRLDEALSEFQEAAGLKPDYSPIYYYLGVTYAYRGLKDKAIEQFELFLKLSKDETQNQTVRDLIQQLRSQKP